MILADKIVRLRKKNGWSQEELAQKMTGSLKMGKRADRPGAGKNFAAWSVVWSYDRLPFKG